MKKLTDKAFIEFLLDLIDPEMLGYACDDCDAGIYNELRRVHLPVNRYSKKCRACVRKFAKSQALDK